MKRIPSIFNEALAPVTPGPSSSNTAGPMRIASVCRQFFGLPITKASIEMSKYGSFPFTYFGMRSDLAFVFGLLGHSPSDPGFFGAYEEAKEKGVEIDYGFCEELPAEPGEYVRLVLENAGTGRKMTFCGASVGGGGFYLESADGCPFHTGGYTWEVLLFTAPAGEVRRHDMVKAILTIAGDPEEIKVCEGPDKLLYDVKLANEPTEEQLAAFRNIEGLLHFGYAEPAHTIVPSEARPPVFETPAELLSWCDEHGRSFWEAACDYEASLSGWTEEQVFMQAGKLWDVILESERKGYQEGNDLHQLLGPKSPQVKDFYENSPQKIAGGILDTAAPASLSIMEWAGSSGTIVCIPTGGASGIVPGVILGLCKEKGWGREEAVKGLLAAGLVGVFMAETDYFGGWGCQAEIGCGVGMAAAGLVCMMDGTVRQCLDAASMGIQSLIGLVCDSVCGESQVPCYVRNMTGCATALACANAAMAGLDALIPLDEMVTAMMKVGRASRSIRLNSMGANGTPTGVRLEAEETERQQKAVDEKLGKH